MKLVYLFKYLVLKSNMVWFAKIYDIHMYNSLKIFSMEYNFYIFASSLNKIIFFCFN